MASKPAAWPFLTAMKRVQQALEALDVQEALATERPAPCATVVAGNSFKTTCFGADSVSRRCSEA